MRFFIKVHVNNWIADMQAGMNEEMDVASTLSVLEQKLTEYIAVNNALETEQIELECIGTDGNDDIEYQCDDFRDILRAAELKEQIKYDLIDFPWYDGNDIVKVM